ncbi:hypothetical protein ACMD2_09428 [Ananas comosus]|uniref:Plus3 domain-containing protein n=1 Tax=Ananas comosus TaxID=4615 RepID=A0A199W634_ANACO|nr:hypothetical protein ACMD2_09428 [Ananas comosus]
MHKDLGAGVNASSNAGMVFITTSPLSELVWSPHKGLSLRYAGSGLDENKASLLWNTDSFNKIFSSPNHTVNGENSHSSLSRDLYGRNLENMQLEPNGQDKNLRRSSSVDVQPRPLIKSSEQASRSCGDLTLLNTMENTVNRKGENQQLQIEETGLCSLRNRKECGIINAGKDKADAASNKNSTPGPQSKGLGADSISCNQKELNPDAEPKEIQCASTLKFQHNHLEKLSRTKNYNVSGLVEKSAQENSGLRGNASNVRSKSSSVSASFSHNDLCIGKADGFTGKPIDFQTNGRQHSGGMLSKDLENGAEVGVNVVSQSRDTSENEDLLANLCNPRAKIVKKGKEKVIYDEKDNESFPEEREDSRESVESSNGRRLVSKGKRVCESDSEIYSECKKIKKGSDGSSYSGTFLRKNSSFMNWISTITNGPSTSDHPATSLALVQQSSDSKNGSFDPLPISHKNDKSTACGIVGFTSLFQSLYCPSIITSSMNDDHKREATCSEKLKYVCDDSHHNIYQPSCDRSNFNLNSSVRETSDQLHNNLKKLPGANETLAVGSIHFVCDREDDKLQNQVSDSAERLHKSICQLENPPPAAVGVSTVKCTSFEQKENIERVGMLHNMGSPSSSNKDGPEIACSVHKSSSNLAINNSSGFLESFWITRLFPKIPPISSEPAPCNLGNEFAMERLKERTNMLCSSSNEDAALVTEQNKPDNCSVLNQEGQRSFCDRMDQKLMSNLSPISSSQNFSKSETIASLFAKRLDALRHIKPSSSSCNVSPETSPCFFCGWTGENSKECSEKINTNLDIPLETWPVACLQASSKGKNIFDNSCTVNNGNHEKIEEKIESQSPSSHDGRIILWSKDKQKDQRHACLYTVNQGRVGKQTKLAVHGIDSNAVTENLGEKIVKFNQMASNSSQNKSNGYQVQPYCNLSSCGITDETTAIFEALRQLQLSRTAVIRWLKSPITHVALDGFFLRLRIGKWEKELGGTGYRVARVNGATCDNCLSVSVGDFTCSVDCRFVSNHDFLEDELRAWWSAVLKGDCELPSREELNRKLRERELVG